MSGTTRKRDLAELAAGRLSPARTSEFWANVPNREPGECWPWQGVRAANGYGRFKAMGTWWAHRVAYMLARGPIGTGLVIDHLCANKPCVNPDHLDPVTIATNTLRCETSILSINRAKTHCPQGHAYDEGNTQWTRQGWRLCRKCRAARDRIRHQTRSRDRSRKARAA